MGLDRAEREALCAGAAGFGVDLDAVAAERFERFVAELELWSERANLLASGERPALVARHLIDSLASVPLLRRLGAPVRILDIGSGAGFPGVPLALALDDAKVTLLEPRRRRANFLRAVSRALGGVPLAVREARLADVKAERSEAASGEGADADPWDALVMRAALPLSDLHISAVRLLAPAGLAVAYRGVNVERSDLEAVEGLEGPDRLRYRLPGRSGEFSLLVWRKPTDSTS